MGDTTLLRTLAGSHAFGTFLTNGSGDVDELVVSVLHRKYYMGLPECCEAASQQKFVQGVSGAPSDRLDVTTHEVTRFFQLLMKGNPSVFFALYSKMPNMASPWANKVWGDLVVTNRHLFFSHNVYAAYCGMASQHGRMLLSAEKGAAVRWKAAMHAVRLMRNLVEWLRDREMVVNRTGVDANYLLEVRQGLHSVGEVHATLTALFEEAEALVKKADLPARVDTNAVSELLVNTKMFFWMEYKDDQ